MPHKDPEKNRENQRKWRERNPEKNREYQRNYRKIKNPNIKPHDSYYDFETHRELAMSSGIEIQWEWYECFKLGLMPDGIYYSPHKKFRRQ